MDSKAITIDVVMDERTFRRFAVFDSLYRQRRIASPVIFTAILTACACLCFLFRSVNSQAVLIGCVLLIIGLGVPVIYLRVFLSSVNMQVSSYRLAIPRRVYSLRLGDEPDGVSVSNPGGEKVKYEWERMHKAYRVNGCSYLYVAPNKAFLLPDSQVDEGPDALWALFSKMMPASILIDRRRKK